MATRCHRAVVETYARNSRSLEDLPFSQQLLDKQRSDQRVMRELPNYVAVAQDVIEFLLKRRKWNGGITTQSNFLFGEFSSEDNLNNLLLQKEFSPYSIRVIQRPTRPCAG